MKYLILLLALAAGRPDWQFVKDQYGHKVYFEVLEPQRLLLVAEENDSHSRWMDVECSWWEYRYRNTREDNPAFDTPGPGSAEDKILLKVCSPKK